MALHIYFDGEPHTWLNIALANITHGYTFILPICLLPLQIICSQMVKVKLGKQQKYSNQTNLLLTRHCTQNI